MKLTVITPSFNQGKYIKRTIESVLTQEIGDIEYIVMDGGSTDETVDILKSFGDRIIWKSERDKGQTDAVNKGVRMASGDIIGWLNSDDIYYPKACLRIMKIFEENPDINVVYGNAYHIDEVDNVIEEYYTEDFDYEKLKEVCFICQPALFFRKSLVDKYGYLDDTLQYCMDYDYWLRLGKGEKFFHLNEFIAGSRLYDDNKTLGCRKKVHEEMIKMQKKVLGKADKKWIYNLAHVIVDEMGIPREKDGSTNAEFAHQLGKVAVKQFFKYYGYVPLSEIKLIMQWKNM